MTKANEKKVKAKMEQKPFDGSCDSYLFVVAYS